MLSNKIYKHFLFEISRYFLLVLFTFTIIVWAVQAVNFLDLIVEDGHGVAVYLSYSLLNIPKILTKFIPLSFAIALFLTILKFESESEFLILWTSGLNKIKIVNFFFKVSILVTLLQLLFASIINPKFLNHSRGLIKSSNLDYVSTMIKSKQFNDTIEGLTIYVEEKKQNGVLKNIFIRDDGNILKSLENSEDSNNVSIFAKEGIIEQGLKGNYLVLKKGTIQKENNKNEILSINFLRTNLQLEGLQTKSIIMPKIQETSSRLLIKCIFSKDTKIKILNCPQVDSKIDTLAELNRRFGMPLYIPAISLILSFLLISRNESKRKNLFKYLYFGLSFLILITAEILVRYSGKSFFYSYLYYSLPLMCVPFFYFLLFKQFYNENLRK
tara:strand:+ start:985 stop:2136 length:1152 start_codon:yes stop_codon:yes gene_type:complete